MNSAGNIEAIRDWANRYYYKEDEINNFFLKASDSNLKAYKLTIIGRPETNVAITENSLTSPQSYNIIIPSNGTYIGLFFFHQGSMLTLNGQTHQLTTYVDVIIINTSYSSVTLQKKLDEHQKSYSSGKSTFTADETALYLLTNIDINNIAQSDNLESLFSGTPLCSRVDTAPYSSPNRNMAINTAVYLLSQGDEVEFINTDSTGGYAIQDHLAFKLLTGYIPTLTHVEHKIEIDGNLGSSVTVNLPTGAYLVIGLTEGVSSGTFSAVITSPATINSNITYSKSFSGANAAGSVAVIEASAASSVTITYQSPTSYCTRGYIIYKLDT